MPTFVHNTFQHFLERSVPIIKFSSSAVAVDTTIKGMAQPST
jgi:hypothetical protein